MIVSHSQVLYRHNYPRYHTIILPCYSARLYQDQDHAAITLVRGSRTTSLAHRTRLRCLTACLLACLHAYMLTLHPTNHNVHFPTPRVWYDNDTPAPDACGSFPLPPPQIVLGHAVPVPMICLCLRMYIAFATRPCLRLRLRQLCIIYPIHNCPETHKSTSTTIQKITTAMRMLAILVGGYLDAWHFGAEWGLTRLD